MRVHDCVAACLQACACTCMCVFVFRMCCNSYSRMLSFTCGTRSVECMTRPAPLQAWQERRGEATAASLRQAFNKDVADAADKLFASHVESAEAAARAWLSGQAAALRIPHQGNPALLDKLQKHLPDKIWKELVAKQEATDLVAGVIAHVADRLRSEASPDVVVLVSTLTSNGDQVFTAMDEKTLDALEPLVTAPPGWLRALPSVVGDFLSPLSAWFRRREQASLQDLGKFLTRLLEAPDPSSVLKDAKDVKSIIAGKAASVQTPLLAVLGAVEEVHFMQGPDTPFSKCSKHQPGGRLQEQLQILDQELLAWAFDPENGAAPAPVLQQAGVRRDLAQNFLVRARAAQSAVGSVQLRRRLENLKTRTTELIRLFDGTPEPPAHEAKFLSYMQKHGGRLSTLLKEIEKERISAESLAKSWGLDRPEIDTDGVGRPGAAASPGHHGLDQHFHLGVAAAIPHDPLPPREKQMRQSLATLSSQLEQDDVGCPVVCLEEAKELLEDPIVVGGTESPAGTVAVASDVVIASPPGAAAARASPAEPKRAKSEVAAAPKARGPKRAAVTG